MYALRTSSEEYDYLQLGSVSSTARYGALSAPAHYAVRSAQSSFGTDRNADDPFVQESGGSIGDNVHSLEVARRRAAAKAHLRMLRHLPANHDGEGAHAPILASTDAALAFIAKASMNLMIGPTLNDDGLAVVEFEDRECGFFADITFLEDKSTVDLYIRRKGEDSILVTAALNSPEMAALMAEAGIVA